MNQRNSPQSYRELLKMLIDLLNEPQEEETDEEVNQYIRDMGYDPDELVSRMQQRIKRALEKSPLNWRNSGNLIRDERSKLLNSINLEGDVASIKIAINRLLELLGGRLALHHRNLNIDEMSENDLAQLRGELEFQLAQKNSSNKNR